MRQLRASQVSEPCERDFNISGMMDFLHPALNMAPVQGLTYHLAQAQCSTFGKSRSMVKTLLSEVGIPVQE